ncbi:MAG TPA: hypothetical protein VGD84_16295 [Pseudonocardiaceae bacterium]
MSAHTAMAVGQCLALRPTVLGLVIAGGFGLLAGNIVVRRRTTGAFGALAPLVVATIIAALSLAIAKHGPVFPPLRPLIAALVTLPPGVALTIATVALASDELVAAASGLALVAGLLLLYSAGIIVAGELDGLLGRVALPDQHADLVGRGAPWLGMCLFVVASSLYFRRPRAWGHRRAHAESDPGGMPATPARLGMVAPPLDFGEPGTWRLRRTARDNESDPGGQ